MRAISPFQHNLMPLPPREKYIDDTDLLIIEDEAQRVVLIGNMPVQSSVTGNSSLLMHDKMQLNHVYCHQNWICNYFFVSSIANCFLFSALLWIFSGTIVAVLGHEENGGKFFVEDYCYSGLPYQAQPDLDLPLIKGEDR